MYGEVGPSVPAGVGVAPVSADADVVRQFFSEAEVDERHLTWS